MLKKSLPIVLALMLGVLAGVVVKDPAALKQWLPEAPPALRRPVNKVPEPIEPNPPELKDTLRELLKATDIQAIIHSMLADPKIDVAAVSQYVARNVVDSPEFQQALSQQLRSNDARKALLEAARSPEFRQVMREVAISPEFIRQMALSPDIQRMCREMVLEAMNIPKTK